MNWSGGGKDPTKVHITPGHLSASQIKRAQGTVPVSDPYELFGKAWREEENADDLLAALHEWRGHTENDARHERARTDTDVVSLVFRGDRALSTLALESLMRGSPSPPCSTRPFVTINPGDYLARSAVCVRSKTKTGTAPPEPAHRAPQSASDPRSLHPTLPRATGCYRSSETEPCRAAPADRIP